MAKKIKNPIEVKIVKQDSQNTVSLHYGLSCEEYPDLEIRKGFIPTLTPAQQTVVDNLVLTAITKIVEHEGIS